MVKIIYDKEFKKKISKINDTKLRNKIITQIIKIKDNPLIGKPLRYSRKNTREVYIKPYRLSYKYLKKEDKLLLLDIYHKDKQ